MPSTPKSILAGIFCLGLSVILFEIALTRVFAIMMWHHFTYMVISIGLLGFGASGSLLTATRLGEAPGTAQRALVWTSLAYGISVVFAFCFATLVRIDSLAFWQQKENFVALFFVYLIIFVPFLLGGLGIGLALTRYVQHVNRLYCGDLVGSACGAAIAVLAMRELGSTATVVAAGCVGLLAAFCFSLGLPRRYLVLTVPGLALAGWLGIGFAGGAPALGIGKLDWRVPFAPGKEAVAAEAVFKALSEQGLLGGQSPELDRVFSATAEVQVGASVIGAPMIGGDHGLDSTPIEARSVGQDGTAPTMLYKGAANLAAFPFLDDTQAASAYVVHRASGRKDQKAMVIGVGGGVDVMVALASGAAHVTAVELNTAMVEMVTQRYSDYLGGMFAPSSPLAARIALHNSEGRAWLRANGGTYDVIQMSGVDSYTALSTGAYTLSESYLYTTEAVADFWSHLAADGIVCWSRFIEKAPRKSRETLRLANIATSSLRSLGVADPAAHVCVFQGLDWASTMVKKSPFTAAEIAALREFALAQGFVGLVFDPLRPRTGKVQPESSHFALLRRELQGVIGARGGLAADQARLRAAVRVLQDCAVNMAEGEALTPAMMPEALRGEADAAAVLQELEKLRPAVLAQAAYMRATTADFATLLRGDDAERARFLADYEFDVSPSTDDAPFFFNYYRWSALFGGGQRHTDDAAFNYHTDFPVGHMVLLGSMAQILLLAALLIFLPLRKLAREGLRTPGSLRVFGYFAALGLGFMLVEIALMQKLVIYLGHPTYALSVVLVSLLASAGAGSFLAGRIVEVRRKHLAMILLGIVTVVALDVAAINWLLPTLLGIPLWARVAVVVVLLVPTGLVLGMPFPTGMRVLEAQSPRLVPWGWAVNAFFSVFGSIFCIVLSMGIGFSNVFWVALGVYALGLCGMRVPRPASAV
ncbi:MAG: hypothetical protein JNK15_19130 [Planctomycetes bacterium]|nr:hypothetical protein [Planctomycetota bacterium]